MTTLLTTHEAEASLQKLDLQWSIIGGVSLDRDYRFDDFKTALDFVNKVGVLAEKQNHHPELTLQWGRVAVRISTHDAGGLTAADFKLAKSIDAI